MEILGHFHPEPATVLRQKMARISMIGSSGVSEAPAQPPASASERVPIEKQHWRCEICKGNWYETDEFGAYWMINKVQILMRKIGALSHECDACTGVTWDGGHKKEEQKRVCTGRGTPPGFSRDSQLSGFQHEKPVRVPTIDPSRRPP